MKTYLSLLLVLTVVAPQLSGAEGERPAPADTAAAFHIAMAQGDEAGVLAALDPEVTIFESGGAELSRGEYASHHLASDLQFSQATERTVVDQRVGGSESSAWIATRSETRGSFRGKEIDLLGTETMLLENDGHGWKIVHIHWSSRARPTPH